VPSAEAYRHKAPLSLGTDSEHSGMDDRDCLAHYRFVVVRIACRVCSRRGSYRLARLAAKYSQDISLRDLHIYGKNASVTLCSGYKFTCRRAPERTAGFAAVRARPWTALKNQRNEVTASGCASMPPEQRALYDAKLERLGLGTKRQWLGVR
jgi:hypothetical protein